MKLFLSILFFLFFTQVSHAGCTGGSNFQTCTDNSGNSYSVSRHVNSTSMYGRNSQTGGSWSQNSQRLGNTTFHNGRSADGGMWSIQDTTLGSTRMINGRDSGGNSVNIVCTQFGCY